MRKKVAVNVVILLAVMLHQTERLRAFFRKRDGEDASLTSEEETIRATYASFTGCGSSEARADFKKRMEKVYAEKGKKLNPAVWERIAKGEDAYPILPLACIIPTSNPNMHNYDIGETVMLSTREDLQGVGFLNTEEGNYLPRERKYIEVASPEQVKAYAEEMAGIVGFAADIFYRDEDLQKLFQVVNPTKEDIDKAIAAVDPSYVSTETPSA